MDQFTHMGLNIGIHDGATVFVNLEGGSLKVELIQTERFSRIKRDAAFPLELLESAVEKEAGKVNLAFNRYGHMPKEKLVQFIKEKLKRVNVNWDFDCPAHHLAHALSSLPFLPFTESLILVADGLGQDHRSFYEDPLNELKFPSNLKKKIEECNPLDLSIILGESISVYHWKDCELKLVYKEWQTFKYEKQEDRLFAEGEGPGALYGMLAYKVFGDDLSAGKIMGLSSYGNNIWGREALEASVIHQKILELPNYHLNLKEFEKQPIEQFQKLANLSALVQEYLEFKLTDVLQQVQTKLADVKNLVFTGGCALNCLFNDKLSQEFGFSNVIIPPIPTDEGVSLGCALYSLQKSDPSFLTQKVSDPFLGAKKSIPSEQEILSAVHKFNVISIQEYGEAKVANLLKEGEIFFIHQGRSEAGPRALGHRSILACPLQKDIKSVLNSTIKFRESYRPYGLMVLEEDIEKYFLVSSSYRSPYMSFAPKVRLEFRNLLKEVMTSNDTIRIQTISESMTPFIFRLLKELKNQGHPGLLINTSLNTMGMPICETLFDTLHFFQKSPIRFGICENYIIRKN